MRHGPQESIRNWLKANRNLVLFLAMLILILLLPAFEDTRAGELSFAAVNVFSIVVTVAVSGRSKRLYWLSFLLAIPALLFRLVAFVDHRPAFLVWSWAFCAALMLVTIIRLLNNVFQPGRVTRERLFACATNYLVIGLLWCYLYAILLEFSPGAFSGMSTYHSLHVSDMAYFSFNIVTNIALTSVIPVSKVAQVLVILHEFASVFYMAFVISRLVGMFAAQPVAPNEQYSQSSPPGSVD